MPSDIQGVGIQNPATMTKAHELIRACGKDVEEEIEYFLDLHAGRFDRDQMVLGLALIVRRAFRNGSNQ